ncbi:hypothetical protein LAUMK13_03185 [Mycobacterium innocens]|uniref:Uncharacterized protein n=1 Tax=Mycobacterium innocens TaxID=2341083 RepID=A0A498Q5W7_9MYCO|nr:MULTISPECIES: hypothetical protein [Mycobacterium]VBA40691.1 hypothetical protein LAUMK13_03185 [Mycobacterium innocens]
MLLLARMFGLPWFWIVEGGDDVVQVMQDLTVHLGQTLLTAGFGGGDQLQGLLPLLVVLGQELGCDLGRLRWL